MNIEYKGETEMRIEKAELFKLSRENLEWFKENYENLKKDYNKQSMDHNAKEESSWKR